MDYSHSKHQKPEPSTQRKRRRQRAKAWKDAGDKRREDIGPMCERCGIRPSEHRHHKQPKKMGGSNLDAIHSIDNMMLLCGACHDLKHGKERR